MQLSLVNTVSLSLNCLNLDVWVNIYSLTCGRRMVAPPVQFGVDRYRMRLVHIPCSYTHISITERFVLKLQAYTEATVARKHSVPFVKLSES